jgi:hypothetical protein
VETLLEYHWSAVEGAEWAIDHPCFGSHRHIRRFIFPLRVHGDDASIKTMTGRKLCIVSVHSEFSTSDPLDSRLLSMVVHDDFLEPGATLHEYCDILRWSFACMLEGVYPSTDHTGSLWPAGSERSKCANRPLAGGNLKVGSAGLPGIVSELGSVFGGLGGSWGLRASTRVWGFAPYFLGWLESPHGKPRPSNTKECTKTRPNNLAVPAFLRWP